MRSVTSRIIGNKAYVPWAFRSYVRLPSGLFHVLPPRNAADMARRTGTAGCCAQVCNECAAACTEMLAALRAVV
jgi:hypothetical protein